MDLKLFEPEYYIAETFESIQGEGNCAGVNSLFVRFQHCNLTCSWCDSKFTWTTNTEQMPLTVSELKDIINGYPAPNIIFTGGEPTLYALDALVQEGKKYHVETNGLLLPTESLDITLKNGTRFVRPAMNEAIISDFNWVVSPKMSNAKQVIDEEKLLYWIKKPWCVFKFIISNEKDLEEIDVLVLKLKVDKRRVYVGLEGCTLESQQKPNLVDALCKLGYNFSPRLHIILWGDQRKK